MRIGFVTRDPAQAASARVRILQYLPAFEAAGVEVRVLHWRVANRIDLAQLAPRVVNLARWADAVVLQKPRLSRRLLDLVARANPHLVVDVDDAVWATRKSGPDREFAGRFHHAVDRARVVVTGSSYLASAVSDQHPEATTVVLPSSVEMARFCGGSGNRAADPAPDTDPPVIGWIGTPGNLVDFGDDLVGVLTDLVGEGLARLVIMSSSPLQRGEFVSELEPWSWEREPEVLGSFAIGVMPLPDNERTRGRCSYKAVQYLAAGLPVVASPVGSAPEVVRDGQTGLLADSRAEWDRALRGLLADPGERTRLGAAGRRLVDEEYSVEANGPRWLDVLSKVVGS